MHWLFQYLRLRNLLFALLIFILFLMLIAAVGCTPRQQTGELPPFEAVKPVDSHLTLVIDLSQSFHAQLSRDGKVMAYLMRVIQTFFEAGVGTERNDRLLIAVIDANSNPIFFEGSTRQFQQSFASPDDLRVALFRRANPGGSRVHDTVCDAAQQALSCDGIVPGKTRLSMLILSDMKDNKSNASTNASFRECSALFVPAEKRSCSRSNIKALQNFCRDRVLNKAGSMWPRLTNPGTNPMAFTRFSGRLAALLAPLLAVAVAGTASAQTPGDFARAVRPFLTAHCVECHGPDKQKGNLRVDDLAPPQAGKKDGLALWSSIHEQVQSGQMPPAKSPRPKPDHVEPFQQALRAELARAGVVLDSPLALAYPIKGNLVPHDLLFGRPSTAAPATPARLWRLSPFAYREFADELTGGKLIVQGGPAVRAKMMPIVVTPFGLTSDHGFRDYAFRYQITGSESQQLAMNGKLILDGMLTKRVKFTPPRPLAAIAEAKAAPTAEQVRAAVAYLFGVVLYREPTEAEAQHYAAFLAARIERSGNRDGLIQGLVPVFLHPEAVFRSEFGAGQPDAHGRLMLSPTELAVAVAYALTDRRPDATLLAAARSGKLASAADVRREASRLLNDATIPTPRLLRFFQEYFEYDRATEVFKDDDLVRAAGIYGPYKPGSLVEDTDRLVLHVLKDDRDVLKRLLTTDQSFVGVDEVGPWNKFAGRRETMAQAKGAKPPTHPFGTRPGQNQLYKHYNFDPSTWSPKMPLALPADQRAGILTQPSWLIAHSANTENHAIHRGKFVRERLLGGSIPDTPITVEAKLPDEPKETLRHRMRVTREDYCFKCHAHMDPLGLPFEMYDHFGQFRTTELGKPVDVSGEVVASGDPRLDGKVTGALELIRRLADSERVEQVFVRHAFRYWMGRNETLDDAPTLQAAHRAYRDSQGSMKALVIALLTSDSFLYRRPDPNTPARN